MPSIQRGASSTSANPVLDLFTTVGGVLTDIAVLEFRIFDISSPAKKGSPVQVYPTTPGTWSALDPTQDAPDGHRLGVGHYYAPWTVPLSEEVGDHKIEWRFKQTILSTYELSTEEFYVEEGASPSSTTYVSIAEIRAEGFDEEYVSDARIEMVSLLVTKYIDKMTGRWFGPRTFDANNPMVVDGRGSQILHLDIPIIRLDAISIRSDGFFDATPTTIGMETVRAYNRHISGMVTPDDRENPRITFIPTRLHIGSSATGNFWPAPLVFPKGRLNVLLQGVFGYTDPNGTEFGEIPKLIRLAALRLAILDLLQESKLCERLNVRTKFRYITDREGSQSVTLQALWLKGAFTGNSDIDNILMTYKRPPAIGIA